MLQALELVNGTALATRLTEGAKALLASNLGRETDADKVIRTLYRRASGRLPNEEELVACASAHRHKQETPRNGRRGGKIFCGSCAIVRSFSSFADYAELAGIDPGFAGTLTLGFIATPFQG